MPFYNVSRHAALDPLTRKRVVEAITDVHCEVTGAPREFVNVGFFYGCPLGVGQAISVIAAVRKGGNRTVDLNNRLQTALRNAVARAAGAMPDEVAITLFGVAAGWVMEGGRVLPEPGSEGEWLPIVPG